MEELTIKDLYEYLDDDDLSSDTYKKIFSSCNYTHEQLANMIFLKRSATVAWSSGQKQATKGLLKLLILELIARKKGYKNLLDMSKNTNFNDI